MVLVQLLVGLLYLTADSCHLISHFLNNSNHQIKWTFVRNFTPFFTKTGIAQSNCWRFLLCLQSFFFQLAPEYFCLDARVLEPSSKWKYIHYHTSGRRMPHTTTPAHVHSRAAGRNMLQHLGSFTDHQPTVAPSNLLISEYVHRQISSSHQMFSFIKQFQLGVC